MAVFSDHQGTPVRSGTTETVIARAIVSIGASGAATLNGDPHFTSCTKNTTGTYDLVFLAINAATVSRGTIRVWIQKSATPTVAAAYIKSYSLTSGTCQFITYLNAAGTPVEPASGDEISIEIIAGTSTGV